MKVRIKFSKHGPLRFIGHLDVMRYFQKVFRRADIDVKFSTGFSPHPIMSFAMALSVGFESNGEYLDTELNTPMDMTDLKDALNKASTEEIRVESCGVLPEDAGNAMASVASASYYVRIRDGFIPEGGWDALLQAFMERDTIEVLKKTDKQEFIIDLKQSIYELRYVEKQEWKSLGNRIGTGDLTEEEIENSQVLYFMVNASSSGNIKPVLLMQEIYKQAGIQEIDPFMFLITRDDLYRNAGTDDDHGFVPLSACTVS